MTVEKWKERERRKEAQILARGMAQGRAQGIEFVLERQAARRFDPDTGGLSALLAGVSEPGFGGGGLRSSNVAQARNCSRQRGASSARRIEPAPVK